MPDEVTRPLVGLWRAVASVALAYAFVIVLMTASAQQRVVTALEAGNNADLADYSSALTQLKESEKTREQLNKLLDRQRGLRDDARRLEQRVGQSATGVDAAWAEFQPIAWRAASEPGCSVPGGSPNVGIWNAVLQCMRDGALPPRIARQVDEARHANGNFADLYNAMNRSSGELKTVQGELEQLAQDIEATRADITRARQVQSAFGELNVLRKSWTLAGGLLVEFPPTLMQIILSFVAGAFGALLITLVLVVYPKNSLEFTRGEGHETRILLGGLIALCVYIVLGGGAAILGSSHSFDGGKANVMTFSAVGVLAGMFSDRVAAWLSGRADAFFEPRPQGG